jgi:hypothetical protein
MDTRGEREATKMGAGGANTLFMGLHSSSTVLSYSSLPKPFFRLGYYRGVIGHSLTLHMLGIDPRGSIGKRYDWSVGESTN